jgi:hypothetical protein
MSDYVLAEVVSDASGTFAVERPETVMLNSNAAAGVIEMLLKNPGRLNRLVRDPARQRELVPSLLAVALFGLAMHGIVLTAIVNALAAKSGFWLTHMPASRWDDLSAANLTLSYTIGTIAANGICLPSFYFYGLLAGVRISPVGVTAHALKGLAAGAVVLVGLLPIYVAVALSAIVFPFDLFWARYITLTGLVLPCFAGLAGDWNLYQGFIGLADTMPANRCGARACFLRRLTLAWVSCATFVTPVVIYSLWHLLANLAPGPVGW